VRAAALLVLALFAANTLATECAMSMKEVRSKVPQLSNLDDQSAVVVLQRVYYPHMSVGELAAKLCVDMSPPKQPAKLGPIDRWRYESCQQDAAKAPTPQGVNIGMRLCREKFDQ
jgi:hypothetical protein